ncbi:hypothetical protein MMC07_001012 [Pseudocyphellaria aurata]|nr:hypothetical protein [Pseudocyphellaria aurata]
MSEKNTSDSSQEDTSEQAPLWKQILLPVEERIEAICQGEERFLIAILVALTPLKEHLKVLVEIPGARVSVEQGDPSHFRALDDDVKLAFNQIMKNSWSPEDVEAMREYVLDLIKKTEKKHNELAFQTASSEEKHT